MIRKYSPLIPVPCKGKYPAVTILALIKLSELPISVNALTRTLLILAIITVFYRQSGEAAATVLLVVSVRLQKLT